VEGLGAVLITGVVAASRIIRDSERVGARRRLDVLGAVLLQTSLPGIKRLRRILVGRSRRRKPSTRQRPLDEQRARIPMRTPRIEQVWRLARASPE